MKFGVREICDVVFKANQIGKIGSMQVEPGQPVLYIDSAKTSTIEGASTTVYATGGKGNARLISWEGEKTLTFTVEDALLSPIGFHILSGAGLFEAGDNGTAYVHTTAIAQVTGANKDTVTLSLEAGESIAASAHVFVLEYDNGTIGKKLETSSINGSTITLKEKAKVEQVFVDFYVEKKSGVTELQIDAENFAGFYYVEASTLFRRESDGKDLPAEIVFPKVKIQSNFTFSMSSSGDPSTFTFTMDAMPGYTFFNNTKKVLCAMQVIDDSVSDENSQAVTMKDDILGVRLNETSLELAKEDVYTLRIVQHNASSIAKVEWLSNDEEVATVANGKVTGVEAGEAEITVTITDSDGKTATNTCAIVVLAD